MHDKDNDLMERAKNGDKGAYEALVSKHRINAINFAYGHIFDLCDAEDIVQECFVKAYISRMEYKPSNTFKTYLFAIIRNACIDYLRQTKNKKSQTVSLEDIAEISQGENPEEAILKAERMEAIFRHMDALPDDYKTALHLFAVDEMNYGEIAKIMRKTIPQVKIIIHRARKKLKKLCEGDDIF